MNDTGNIRLNLERNGRISGFQRMNYEIKPDGKTTKTVQTAFDNFSALVSQRPGKSKNNLYDVKKCEK